MWSVISMTLRSGPASIWNRSTRPFDGSVVTRTLSSVERSCPDREAMVEVMSLTIHSCSEAYFQEAGRSYDTAGCCAKTCAVDVRINPTRIEACLYMGTPLRGTHLSAAFCSVRSVVLGT